MSAFAVLLSGENATLPAAELRALLDVHDPDARLERQGIVAIVHPKSPGAAAKACSRMALAHEWGHLWAQADDTPDGLAELVAAATHVRLDGAVAVVAERRAGTKGLARGDVERAIGAALAATGHRIDLRNPTNVAFAWLADGRIWLGLRGGLLDRSAHEGRTSDERAHFSPVSMHPRRAASLVHLARVPLGGRVLDPFCGTGGIVLEAALEGYVALGSDLDRFMVQGTMTTLTDAGPEPLEGTVFRADIGDVPALVDPVDAVVTDLPYGRASSSHDEELAALYDRAFAAFAAVVKPGGHVVVGYADETAIPPLARHGLMSLERHEERMHKSLTRRFLVARRD